MQLTGFIVLRHRQLLLHHQRHHKLRLNARAGVGSGIRLPVRVRQAEGSSVLVRTIARRRCLVSRDRAETVVLDQPISVLIHRVVARVAMRMQGTVAAVRLSTLPF